jgi:hypothetical protein
MFVLGLWGTIYLVLSDLDLRWKIVAVALFGLGLVVGVNSWSLASNQVILARAIHSVLALWGFIHWQQ